MKRFHRFLLSAAAVLTLGACQQSEIDDLERDIDDLRSRLTALETQVDALNNNVEALQKLLNGATVNSVEEQDGVYTITLSNGEVLTLTQGSEGGYYTPIIGVDEAGYWTVSFDGSTYERITDTAGNPVRAVAEPGSAGEQGEDGATPQFKVDAEGNWIVSYDGGETFVQVLGADGNPVNATSGAVQDKFFADVHVADGGTTLVVTLLDGYAYEIPIFANFKCVIAATGEEVVYFAQKETRDFDVTLAGVAATVLTAPEGWTATLTAKEDAGADAPNHTLTVTAPAAGTRATADSRIDVCILAVADNGLSTIAKLHVATNDMVLHTPVVKSVTVDAAKTTETSLTFSVVTDDANGWKYICRPSEEEAPDAAEVFETGSTGGDGAVTAEGLVQGTAYTIYVVAHYDSTAGTDVATTEARTAKAAVDYWEEGVTIDGVTYDKNTSGAQLVTTTTEISAAGVYFLDPEAGASITVKSGTYTELVLIGRHSLSRAAVTLASNPILLGNGSGLILKNVEFDASAFTTYVLGFAVGGVTAQHLIIEDSKITGPKNHFSYFSNSGKIGKISVDSSIYEVPATADALAARFINFNTGSTIAENGSCTIRNSVFYTRSFVTHGTLLHINGANDTMPTVTVEVSRCSLINYIGQPNAYFYLSTVGSVKFSNNILWSRAYAKESFVFRFYTGDEEELDYRDNLAYGLADNNNGCWKYFQTSSAYIPETGGYYTKETSDPFSTMDFETDTFVPADNAYGAEL